MDTIQQVIKDLRHDSYPPYVHHLATRLANIVESPAEAQVVGGGQPMTDAEVRQWIGACNHEPARQVLRDYLQLRALSAQPRPEPDGYHYRYPYGNDGSVIRKNNGEEVNGCRPLGSVPYWYAAPQLPSAPVVTDGPYGLRMSWNRIASSNGFPCDYKVVGGFIEAAQQPAAVDESAIRRALDAHGQALGEGTAWDAMRTALYAALAQPQGEG